MKVRYTGAGPDALLLCKDKSLAKKLLSYHRVRVARFVVSPGSGRSSGSGGSSFPRSSSRSARSRPTGSRRRRSRATKARRSSGRKFLHERFEGDALIEEYIEGRELYVGVLGNTRLTVLPPREIFFDEAARRRAEVRHREGQVGRRLPEEVGHPERAGGGARSRRW